jgi:hypothetical protein
VVADVWRACLEVLVSLAVVAYVAIWMAEKLARIADTWYRRLD